MPILAQPTAPTSGGGGTGTLLILAIPLLLIGFMMFSQRRRQRQAQQVQAELQPGDEVMTSTGLYGTISFLEESVVHLEIAPGLVVEWDRRAIVRSPRAAAAQYGAAETPGIPDDPQAGLGRPDGSN